MTFINPENPDLETLAKLNNEVFDAMKKSLQKEIAPENSDSSTGNLYKDDLYFWVQDALSKIKEENGN